jgi:hypothetical protein
VTVIVEMIDMNERIKELAEQATQEFSPAFDRDKWQDKFAELIVEECGRVADVFCHIWCEEDKPHDVTVSNYIKRHVLRADPE